MIINPKIKIIKHQGSVSLLIHGDTPGLEVRTTDIKEGNTREEEEKKKDENFLKALRLRKRNKNGRRRSRQRRNPFES